MTDILSHLTLNTGHLVEQARASIPADMIDQYLPVVDAQGGPLPRIDGWFVDLIFPLTADGARRDGTAFFGIADEPGQSNRPAVMGMVCWRPDVEDEAWRHAIDGYNAMRRSLEMVSLWRTPPARPPQLPWMVVWLMPFIAIADREVALSLGRAEQAIAWALMT